MFILYLQIPGSSSQKDALIVPRPELLTSANRSTISLAARDLGFRQWTFKADQSFVYRSVYVAGFVIAAGMFLSLVPLHNGRYILLSVVAFLMKACLPIHSYPASVSSRRHVSTGATVWVVIFFLPLILTHCFWIVRVMYLSFHFGRSRVLAELLRG